MATEIAGLPASLTPDGMTAALDAVAVIRGLDADGNPKLYLARTERMPVADAAGLLHVASQLYVASLAARP